MVLEALHPQRDASRTRLFQVTFVLQNTRASSLEIPDMSFSSIETEGTRSNFDLTLWMWESPDGLAGSLEYNTGLFDASTIQRMIGHFTLLLQGIVANPDERIGELQLLGPEELRRLLVEWNDNDAEVPQDEFVHELFEAQAAAQPEAVAVVFEDTNLTYGELNARSNQLARYLQSQGVGPETRVGICMERSVEMVVGLLGVLKAGGAYVPLDPAYPKERLAFMMADAQAPLLLTQQRLLQSLPAAEAQALEAQAQVDQVRALCIDADAELLAQHSTENLPRTVAAANLAYLIYTSGSTQRPRAAMISHSSLANAFAAWEQAYSLSTEIKCNLQTASFAFDVFTGDVVRAMCSGGKLVICPNDLLLSAPDFYALLRREQVECIEIVPAILRNLTQYLEETNQTLDFMRLVVAGADALYVNEFEHARQFCGTQTRLVNTYGLTEATIDTSYFETGGSNLLAGKLVPIGRPFANTKIYILDRNYQPVPSGVAGELHVGGPSLARGYLKHPDLTATKFIPNPFSDEPGARLYRTGDLARYLPDGNVEFLGRNDYQVKVRGFRIELEEIETTLLMHGDVRQAVVVAHESAPGEKHLVAYIVAQTESDPSIQELRQLVKQHLPAYMAPAAFVMLDALPLTPNGKVNRRQLPAPDMSLIESATTYVEPGTEVEELLAEIWSEVLGRKKIGVLDNFFESGGHSLLATQVVARVRKTFNVELPLRKLFETPTIAELAITIEEILLEEIERLNDDEAQPQPVS
jgi:amino acid adenylation domain-containing protein